MDFKQEDLKSCFLGDKKIEKETLFPTCTLVDDKIYAYTSFKRLPIVGDLHTGKVTLLKNVKDYDMSFYADSMLSDGDNIFVLELNGKRMLKYSINESTCQYFDIGCHGRDWDNYAAFAQWDKYLYVVPRYIDGLMKIDSESGEAQKERTADLKANKNDASFFWCGCQSGNRIWLLKKTGTILVAYDMEKNIWKEFELSVSFNNCAHMTQYGKKIYMLSSEGNVCCWDMEKRELKLLTDSCEDAKGKDIFSRIVVTDKKIFLLPSFGKDIFTIDLETKQTEKYASYPSDFLYCGCKEWSKYYGYCEDDNYYYFAMRSMNYILILDKRNGRENWIKPQLPSYKDVIATYMKYDSEVACEMECSMDDILNYVMDRAIKSSGKDKVTLAEGIWKQVKESVK